jgi:hypothetical protein
MPPLLHEIHTGNRMGGSASKMLLDIVVW